MASIAIFAYSGYAERKLVWRPTSCRAISEIANAEICCEKGQIDNLRDRGSRAATESD